MAPTPLSDVPAGADSAFDVSGYERSLLRRDPRRWMGWRLRLLVLTALLAGLAVLAVMRALAGHAHLDATWQATAKGQLTLLSSPLPALQPLAGRTLQAITTLPDTGLPPLVVDDKLLPRTARWLVDDGQRQRYLQAQDDLAARLATGRVQLLFTDGSRADVATPPRGFGGLGLLFWPLTALALLLALVGAAALLQAANTRNALYALMACGQAANLLLMAAEPSRGLGQPAGFAGLDLALRMVLDVLTATAGVYACTLHPRRHARADAVMLSVAIGVVLWAVLALTAWRGVLPPWAPSLWAATQALLLLFGSLALGVLSSALRTQPDPRVRVLRRLVGIAVATLALLTLAVAATHRQGGAPGVAAIGAMSWHLFVVSLLLLLPFLSGPRPALREFVLLAGIGTVVTSLVLLLVTLVPLGPAASVVLAAALLLLIYSAARKWILAKMVGARVLTTERTFEQLYRVAREVQEHPARTAPLLAGLLGELFDPQERLVVPRRLHDGARVAAAGAALYVPLPGEGGSTRPDEGLSQVLVLRHASRGQRIFTDDDARLASRVVDQVCRAAAYDRAVEQGRAEERQRIAQDLHDDIGARLLTLMYKASDREMEEYIRHTLLDLKTLTRGLAASSHSLSHAAAEWKADLQQRLAAAKLRFEWQFEADHDPALNVVQWSALTRILRELVSNAIYHAQAARVQVSLRLAAGTLTLRVADDGGGTDPAAWSHGLGLGGVRKRVRALGGRVQWVAAGGGGIVCEVQVPGLAPPAGG